MKHLWQLIYYTHFFYIILNLEVFSYGRTTKNITSYKRLISDVRIKKQHLKAKLSMTFKNIEDQNRIEMR